MNTTVIKDENFRDLGLLMAIQADPDICQAKLAENLGVAIGTVNGRLRRLSDKGLIRVNHLKRRKLRYTITPKGKSLQETLTQAYVEKSFYLFRQIRQQVKQLLAELDSEGVNAVHLDGDGDIAEICRLTCLEQGFQLNDDQSAPALVVNGIDINLERE